MQNQFLLNGKLPYPMAEILLMVTFYSITKSRVIIPNGHLVKKIKPTKFPNGTLNDLISGTRYEFRVLAQNRVGLGPPSEVTIPLLVRAQKSPPEISRKAVPESKSVKVNQQFVIEIPVHGVPEPDITWWHKEAQVLPSNNIKISYHQDTAKIIFVHAVRALSGVYTIKANNIHGEDLVEFIVDIYGPPSSPKGPLNISEITKKTCFLQWSFPEDDGGRTISNFEVEKMDVTKGENSWLLCGSPKGLSYRVTNMVEGHKYKFLVRTVNSSGFESPELYSSEDILAKNPYDPPSTPTKPKVMDWGENWADLEWIPPQEDGGTEILEYFVEVRNTCKRNWIQGVVTKSTSCQISSNSGLISPGNDYQFRVAAKNKGGEISEFSSPSSTIKAEVRFIKPKINRDILIAEKNIHAGQTLRLEIEVTSAPLAKVTWYYPNGSEVCQLQEGPKINSGIDEYGLANLSIENILRSDSGIFKCIASNSEGLDEVQVRVEVLDVPSPPIGPLNISDVTPSSCKVSFKRPGDMGGSPITGYQIERRVKDKDVWINCGKTTNKTVLIMRDVECDVKDLIEGQIYFFRASAININGESDPLESKVPICAKSAIELPFPPFEPAIVDWDKKWVSLGWNAASDSNIRHFIVEAQEQFLVPKSGESNKKKRKQKKKKRSQEDSDDEESSSEEDEGYIEEEHSDKKDMNKMLHKEFVEYVTQWTKVLVTEDDSCEAKISDLSEGTKYRFRVRAVNSAGISMPSEETDEIICRIKKQRPTIDYSSLPSEVYVPCGQNVIIPVKVEGQPIPKKVWTYGGKIEIKQSMSIDITNKDTSSKLVLYGGRKDDSGIYTFKASNIHGEDSVDIKVIVMVSPEKPKGPLKIFDINAEGCKAEWNLPENDGGSKITHYVIEKINKSHSEWSTCGRTSGTKVTIVGLTPSKEYRLRVRAVNNEGESDPLEGVDSFITENPWGPPSSPGRPILNDYDHDHLIIKWDPPKNDGGSRVTGYQVQIRPWRGSEWEFAEDVKGQTERTTIDEGLKLGKTYATRVRALNSGGVSPWSIESDPLTVKYKALPPKIHLTIHHPMENKKIVMKAGETLSIDAMIPSEPPANDIVWTLANKDVIDDPLSGIYIDSTHDNFSSIRKTGMTRRDAGIVSCKATNLHGKDICEYEVKVISAPSIPDGTLDVSQIHKSGCRLNWDAPRDNGGLPIEYHVDVFIVKADAWTSYGSTKNLFMDVNDLEHGHEYEFCVKAVNSIGESSRLINAKPILIKDQFTVPLSPYAPEVTDWSERHMDITWKEPIDDGGAYIHGYHIEAKSKDTGDEWQLWETIDTNTCNGKLQNLRQGVFYQFRVIAINKAGKSEPSLPSRCQEAKPKYLLPYIDTKSLHDVTVEVGSRIKFDLPITGEPKPSIEWLHKDTDTVLNSTTEKSLVIENTDNSSKIIFNSVTRSDAGTYVLNIKNSSGTDTAKFNINVLDKPDAPESITSSVLKSDDHNDHPKVSLVWKRCKFDGGSPIEYYQIERFEFEKQGWIACGRSKDNTIDIKGIFNPGESYKFKVSGVNLYGESDAIESTVNIPDNY
ncbi:twitchin [Lepeophtheirus salmonis]|uniref:twitchin n=1 Tax=Lepeophtheirus salmonis TaxID=72036 RepID=UPI001AE42A27|nr:twitchin-like [Lepeophtheirus salmonis]